MKNNYIYLYKRNKKKKHKFSTCNLSFCSFPNLTWELSDAKEGLLVATADILPWELPVEPQTSAVALLETCLHFQLNSLMVRHQSPSSVCFWCFSSSLLCYCAVMKASEANESEFLWNQLPAQPAGCGGHDNLIFRLFTLLSFGALVCFCLLLFAFTPDSISTLNE